MMMRSPGLGSLEVQCRLRDGLHCAVLGLVKQTDLRSAHGLRAPMALHRFLPEVREIAVKPRGRETPFPPMGEWDKVWGVIVADIGQQDVQKLDTVSKRCAQVAGEFCAVVGQCQFFLFLPASRRNQEMCDRVRQDLPQSAHQPQLLWDSGRKAILCVCANPLLRRSTGISNSNSNSNNNNSNSRSRSRIRAAKHTPLARAPAAVATSTTSAASTSAAAQVMPNPISTPWFPTAGTLPRHATATTSASAGAASPGAVPASSLVPTAVPQAGESSNCVGGRRDTRSPNTSKGGDGGFYDEDEGEDEDAADHQKPTGHAESDVSRSRSRDRDWRGSSRGRSRGRSRGPSRSRSRSQSRSRTRSSSRIRSRHQRGQRRSRHSRSHTDSRSRSRSRSSGSSATRDGEGRGRRRRRSRHHGRGRSRRHSRSGNRSRSGSNKSGRPCRAADPKEHDRFDYTRPHRVGTAGAARGDGTEVYRRYGSGDDDGSVSRKNERHDIDHRDVSEDDSDDDARREFPPVLAPDPMHHDFDFAVPRGVLGYLRRQVGGNVYRTGAGHEVRVKLDPPPQNPERASHWKVILHGFSRDMADFRRNMRLYWQKRLKQPAEDFDPTNQQLAELYPQTASGFASFAAFAQQSPAPAPEPSAPAAAAPAGGWSQRNEDDDHWR